MRRRILLPLVAGASVLGLFTQVAAADFTPTIEFSLSDYAVNANPELSVKVAQDQGEEELDLVQLNVPAGFTLATDEQLPNGTQLGSGSITIHVGPRCRNPSATLSAPATVAVRINERDRTAAETSGGAVAIYVVDLRPVTSIDLKVTGSSAAGWTLSGSIPPNADTCPPFTFDAKFFKTAAGKPVFLNPSTGGAYTFKARFVGLQGSVSETSQTVNIVGGKAAACSGKAATMAGSEGDDVLTGTKGNDVVLALGGNDTIKTSGGKDRICAGAGNDKVSAGGANDLVLGEAGNDKINGGPGKRDKCVGGSGKDGTKACELGKR